jgi:hypothetical protein
MAEKNMLDYATPGPVPTRGERLGLVCHVLTYVLAGGWGAVIVLGRLSRGVSVPLLGGGSVEYAGAAIVCNGVGLLMGPLAMYPGKCRYVGIPLLLHFAMFALTGAALSRW